MHYTKEWEGAERLVEKILLPHSHGWEGESWMPSAHDVLQAIISFAALGVPGCVTALKAERTAIYEKMRESVVAFTEAHGSDPAAILCNKRDMEIAEAPYGIAVVGGVEPGWDGPKTFMFQGTPVKPWRILNDEALPIKAVEVELGYATGRR